MDSKYLTTQVTSYRNPLTTESFEKAASNFVHKLTGYSGSVYPLLGLKQLSKVAKVFCESELGISMRNVRILTPNPGYRSSMFHFTEDATIHAVSIGADSDAFVASFCESLRNLESESDQPIIIWWQTQNPMGLLLSDNQKQQLLEALSSTKYVKLVVEDHAYAGLSLNPKKESVFSTKISDSTFSIPIIVGISTSKVLNSGGLPGGITFGNFSDSFMHEFTNNSESGVGTWQQTYLATVMTYYLEHEVLFRESATKNIQTAQKIADMFNLAGIQSSCPEIGPFCFLDLSKYAEKMGGDPHKFLRDHKFLTLPGQSTNLLELPNAVGDADFRSSVRLAFCVFDNPDEAIQTAAEIIKLIKSL